MVLVVSFPKTGSNWTMEVIRQILYSDDDKLNKLSKAFPPLLMGILETWKPEKFDPYEHIPLPRKILYTHLPEELMNFENMKKAGTKVIVLVRNPKDQAVSWFHFSRNRWYDGIRDELTTDWNIFISDFMDGKHPQMMRPGEFHPDYLRGWYKHKSEDNVMSLCFEDMKKDAKREIKKLAEFLEVKISEERADAITKATTFNAMKKKQDEKSGNVTKAQSTLNLLRSGQVGGWKNYFTVAQSETMDKIIEERLGDTDIKFIYE